MEGDIRKDSTELEGRLKVGRGRWRKSSNAKGELFKEPDWGELKFPKEANEVLYYSRQKHANMDGGKTELAENTASRGSRRVFESNEKFPWKKQAPTKKTKRYYREPER